MNNKNMSNQSYLEIIVGPMFSGKTSKLIEIYKQCIFCDIPVVIINYDLDKRYDDKMMSSHDKIMVPCIQANKLNDVIQMDEINNCQVILINEAQFFEDLFEIVLDLLNKNKKIYLAGLDGDFERKKFGKVLDLIPYCDKIIKLTSLCSLCKNGTSGIFSMRLTKEKEQTVIGSDNYIPVCRVCYEKNV